MGQYQLYINGEFVDSKSSEKISVINPATEEVISQVPDGNADDAQAALEVAQAAQKAWAAKPAIERAGYLKKIAEEIRKNVGHLAKTISEEQGKVLSLAETEVNFAADYFDYNAEWARRYEGDIVQSDRRNENILIYKLPIGVVVGICAWNFPFFLIVRKMAPALVTGNTIVIKPSSLTPNNAFEFARIVDKIGLPKGLFNVVSGSGSGVGNELVKNPITNMVSLTGSVEAGQQIMAAAAPNITKVSLELGGKAPAIVWSDADIDLAVDRILNSRVINTGQVCNCAERIYVHEKVAEEFTEKMCNAMKAVTVGDPFANPNPDMGPLASEEQLGKVESIVDRAVKDGAEVLVGGKHPEGFDKGYYYEATVLANCRQDMEIMQKEIFGPVLPIMTVNYFDQTIEYANDSEYGLTSSIYTNDINLVMRANNELKFGETYVNRENFEAMQGFHAGWRKSGIGGADGKYGLNEYLQTHVVYIQYK